MTDPRYRTSMIVNYLGGMSKWELNLSQNRNVYWLFSLLGCLQGQKTRQGQPQSRHSKICRSGFQRFTLRRSITCLEALRERERESHNSSQRKPLGTVRLEEKASIRRQKPGYLGRHQCKTRFKARVSRDRGLRLNQNRSTYICLGMQPTYDLG